MLVTKTRRKHGGVAVFGRAVGFISSQRSEELRGICAFAEGRKLKAKCFALSQV